MSTLDEDDADKQLQRAVPWVSNPQDREQRDNETRRLEEDVMEAAKRLERESARLPSQPPADPRTAVGFRMTEPSLRGGAEPRRRQDNESANESGEDRAKRIWSELKPRFVPQPARDGLPRLVMVAGLLGAMALSAIAAMVVVSIVPPPTTNADVTSDERAPKSEERAPKGNSFAAATLGDLARISEAQAKMTRADETVVPAETLLAAAPPNEIAAPKPPGPTSLPPTNPIVESAKPEIATPAPSPVPSASASPALPQDEIASLLKRGRDLIASGDVASARLVLTLVAEGGNAEAAFTLAGTFDPFVLASLRAIGVQGDPTKARTWYTRAAELGSLEARQRLQALR
jgi:hypothetical protein